MSPRLTEWLYEKVLEGTNRACEWVASDDTLGSSRNQDWCVVKSDGSVIIALEGNCKIQLREASISSCQERSGLTSQ